jgi:hypothetical protein
MIRPGLVILLLMVLAGSVAAQDVPGIEICTVEKTMERRTSCLQSNVDFLQKTITRNALDHQAKLDARFDTMARDIQVLKAQFEAQKALVTSLQKTVEQLQAQIPADKNAKDPQAK